MASDAPAPALDPPGDIAVFQGLRTMPNCELRPLASMPMSGMVVLAMTMAPDSLRRAMGSESNSETGSPSWMALPCHRRIPVTQ